MSEIDNLGPKPPAVPTQKTSRDQHRQIHKKAEKKKRKKTSKKPPSDHQLDEYV